MNHKTYNNKIKRPVSAGATADWLTILANALSIFATIAGAVWGASINFGVITLNFTNISINNFNFSLRLVLLTILSAALGWALGAISTFLTNREEEHWAISSYFIAIIWAGILVTFAEALANDSRHNLIPNTPFFTLVGSGVVLWILNFKFRSISDVRSAHLLRKRASCILAFSFSTLVILFVNEITGGR